MKPLRTALHLTALLLAALVGQADAQIAPTITLRPINRLVSVGTPVTFSVTATGTPPPTYQWAKNGVVIPGATSSTYTVSNAQLTDAARYAVSVSNASGSTETGASLVILPTGSFNGSDAFSTARNTALWGVNDFASAGSALTESGGKLVLTGTANAANYFQVSAGRAWQTGLAPFASDWAAEVEVTVPNAVFTGANQKAKWKLFVVNAADSTDYLDLRLQSSFANGQFVRSEPEINGLDVPTSNLNSAVGVGETVRLRMTWTASTKVMRLDWIAGAFSNYLGSHNLGPGPTEFANCTGFLLGFSGETEGMSPQGLLVADNFTTTQPSQGVAPVITLDPISRFVSVGTPVTFSVTATGTPPPTYQWAKNGVVIPGATSSTYTVSNAQLTDAAEYAVTVSNASGSEETSASLVILPTGVFTGSDAFSTTRNTALWGLNDFGGAGSALTESGGKLVLTGTTNSAANPSFFPFLWASRAWQSGLAPFASDWATEVEVTMPNAVFTGPFQHAWWWLSVANAADSTDYLHLTLQSSAANGQSVSSDGSVNGLYVPTLHLNSAVGVGETVRLRMTWTASTKVMQLAWFAGGVSNYLGSHNLGPGSQTEFANCTGFVLSLTGETANMSPLGLLVADNFTTTTLIGNPVVPAGTLQFTSGTASVSESGGSVPLSVTRTGGSAGAVGVSYATANGTATAGTDYTSASGTLSWASGDTASKTITVAILNDTVAENSETFTVALSSPTGGATLGTPSTATVTITDDDTGTVVSATHSAGGYRAGTTLTVTGRINYPVANQLQSLKWTPTLPAGWTVASVTGDGSPELVAGEIVFVASTFPNPVNLTMVVNVPVNQTGIQQVAGVAEYQLNGMVNPATIAATPSPLQVSAVVYHTADYGGTRWVIDGTEVNRVLSYWRAGGYQPNVVGADGYAAGSSVNPSGPRHAADYQGTAWVIDGTEVNRVLSYWRAGGYQANVAGADGFSAGAAPAALPALAASGVSGRQSVRQVAGRLQATALVATSTTSLTQSGPSTYTAGGTVTITNRLVYGGILDALLLRPQLPLGWTITAVAGDGSPDLVNGEIVPTGTLPAGQVEIRYTLQIPTGQSGSKSIRTAVETTYRGDVNASSAFAAPDPLTLTGNLSSQTITFGALASKTFGDAPFTVSATASSTLPVSFSIVSGPATLSGSTITITAAGTVTVRASQVGDATFNAATAVDQSFTVAKANQTITFNALVNKAVNDPAFAVSATASSALPISFSIVSGPATVSGNTITLSGAVGTVVVRAAQGGNANFNAAPSVDQSFGVGKLNQTIPPGTPPPPKTFGDAPFTVNPTASSGLPVSLSIVSGPATLSGNTITLTGAGTVTVRASQAGDATYNAATPVEVSFTVAKANQTITFGALANRLPTDSPFTLTATSDSGLAVTYTSSNPSVATVSGSTVTLTRVEGVTALTASQAGNANYLAAPSVAQTLLVAASSPSISAQPQNQTNSVGLSVTFSVTASGQGSPFTYQWRSNGVSIVGATSSSLTLANIQTNYEAGYSVQVSNSTNTVTSSGATLTVNFAPYFTVQPVSQVVTQGQANVSFTAAATGKPAASYQWRKGGVNIAGATSASYTLASAVAGDAASYDVVASNSVGTTNSAAVTLTVNGPVVFLTQPASQTVVKGHTLTLSVTTSGTQPITYQWQRDGVNVPGATAATLAVPNVQLSDAGSYRVVASNVVNVANSAVATVTVLVAPEFTSQPQNQTILVGGTATFTVAANGTPTLAYQWRKNGTNIAGATGTNFTIASAALTDSGLFDVVVSNPVGTNTSAVAVLAVVTRSLTVLSVSSTNLLAGATHLVPVTLVGSGVENALSFTLAYDTTALGLVGVSNLVTAATLTTTNDAANGLVGVRLALPAGQTFAGGTVHTNLLLAFTNVVTVSTNQGSVLALVTNLVPLQVSDTNGAAQVSEFASGSLDFRVPIAPAAATTMFTQGSGLLNNSVQVRVPLGSGIVGYVRVLITGLGNDSLGNPIRVQNAAGTLNGVPFVLYPGPLTPGQVITLPIQYFISDRTTVPTPQFTVQSVSTALTPPATGTSVQITADPRVDLQGFGFFAVEFGTAAGRTYYVQFRDTVSGAWSTSFPAVLGTGGPVRWVDSGPPTTTSLPTTMRFYRVLEVQ